MFLPTSAVVIKTGCFRQPWRKHSFLAHRFHSLLTRHGGFGSVARSLEVGRFGQAIQYICFWATKSQRIGAGAIAYKLFVR
jgi:hypothetical protein